MKKQLLLFSSLGLCVLLLSNFKLHTNSFIFTLVNEEPVLPSEPFSYDDVEFPEHLLSSSFKDTIDSGYRSGGVDTLAFDLLENDISTLGRVLFYDKKLSALENISCANCHRQSLSFAENKQFSEGINAPTRRNSMNLNDIAWTNNERFFWDMSETDLHEMISLPLTDENEIGADMNDIEIKLGLTTYYPELFEKAFGDAAINEERIVDALVNFISSMTTFNSKFDQQAAVGFSGFTQQEILGKDLFSANCSTCHVQGDHDNFFIDFPDENISTLEMIPFLFNNGLPEDTDDHGAGEWDEAFNNLFKLPSLRNIELTAPYMHDGRFETLEEVVQFYSEESIANEWSFMIPDGGFQFSDEQEAALVSFLKTLTDDSFLTNPRWSDPFGNSTSVPDNSFENLVIKPNPFSEQSILEFDNSLGKLTSINIFSAGGRLVKHDNFSSSTYAFNKTEFSPGMYIIEIIQGDRRQTQKLIVN